MGKREREEGSGEEGEEEKREEGPGKIVQVNSMGIQIDLLTLEAGARSVVS